MARTALVWCMALHLSLHVMQLYACVQCGTQLSTDVCVCVCVYVCHRSVRYLTCRVLRWDARSMCAVGACLNKHSVYMRVLCAGIYDTLRAKLGLSPVYVPLAGPHNSVSVMAMTPSERKSYHAKHPQVMLVRGRHTRTHTACLPSPPTFVRISGYLCRHTSAQGRE